MKRLFFNEMETLTTAGFAAVITLALGVIVLTLWQLDQWNRKSVDLILDASLEAEYTHKMRDAVRKRELSIQHMMNVDSVFERDEEYMRYLGYGAEFANARASIQLMKSTEKIREQYQKLQESVTYAQPYHDRLAELMVHGDMSDEDIYAIAAAGIKSQEKIIFILDGLVQLQRERNASIVEQYENKRKIVLMMTVVIFVISIIIAIVVIRLSTKKFRYVSRLSIIDELTGAYNRRYFDMIMEEEWKRSMRDATSISLIMVDIDYFKNYNDSFGHQMGDVCLFSIAKIMGGQLKRAADFIARYGGEEFVVVLPNTNHESACVLAEKLRVAVEESHIEAGNIVAGEWVTISAGVATTTAQMGQESSLLINAADQCLYQSKQNGRNRVTDILLSSGQAR